jgi:tungstate transport system permease protein
MHDLLRALTESLALLGRRDPEVVAIVGRSLAISGVATLFATLAGVPLGYLLARARFRGRTLLLALVNTGMGLPPVVVGLVVWLLLARTGPLGRLGILYTPTAMVVAQFLIALPLVIGVTAAAVQALPEELPELLRSLGAGRLRTVWLVGREAHLGLLAAVMAGFGGNTTEGGATMTVGGHLRGAPPLLTPALVPPTGRGEVAEALALGLILLLLAFVVNAALTAVQQRRSP